MEDVAVTVCTPRIFNSCQVIATCSMYTYTHMYTCKPGNSGMTYVYDPENSCQSVCMSKTQDIRTCICKKSNDYRSLADYKYLKGGNAASSHQMRDC